MKHLERAATWLVPLLGALLVTSVLIRAAGRSPSEIYRLLVVGTWGNAYGIGQVLFKTTPLLFTGLSVALAQRAGLFNVGAEGQITVGAFAAGICGAYLPAGTPALVAVPACLACAALGGALLGVVPGWMKARRGAHEVITTIMLNFVVRAAMLGLGALVFERESVHTRSVIAGAHLARISSFVPALHGSAANLGLIVALFVVAATVWWVERTRAGFHLRAVGAQPKVAIAAGLAPARVTILAFVLAGAIAGLGGANFVLGYKYYYEDGFSGGVGFVGIAVAVRGGLSPVRLVLAALLYGTLAQGALAVNAVCPKEIIDVLQAVLIVAAAVTTAAQLRAGRRDSP